MRTTHPVSCPLCGLRYQLRAELDLHVREDHAPPSPPEVVDKIAVPARRWYRRRAARPRATEGPTGAP